MEKQIESIFMDAKLQMMKDLAEEIGIGNLERFVAADELGNFLLEIGYSTVFQPEGFSVHGFIVSNETYELVAAGRMDFDIVSDDEEIKVKGEMHSMKKEVMQKISKDFQEHMKREGHYQ